VLMYHDFRQLRPIVPWLMCAGHSALGHGHRSGIRISFSPCFVLADPFFHVHCLWCCRRCPASHPPTARVPSSSASGTSSTTSSVPWSTHTSKSASSMIGVLRLDFTGVFAVDRRTLGFLRSNFPSYPNHDLFEGLVFIDKHTQPSSDPCLNTLLHKYYGNIDPLVTLQYITAVFQTGNMHIAIYDFQNSLMYVCPDGFCFAVFGEYNCRILPQVRVQRTAAQCNGLHLQCLRQHVHSLEHDGVVG
jgi:hypothetical protein